VTELGCGSVNGHGVGLALEIIVSHCQHVEECAVTVMNPA